MAKILEDKLESKILYLKQVEINRPTHLNQTHVESQSKAKTVKDSPYASTSTRNSSKPNTSRNPSKSPKVKLKLLTIRRMRVHLLECLLQNKNQNNVRL